MDEGSSVSAGTLMRDAPPVDAMRESLVLAELQRDLFDRRVAAPVLDRYVLLEKIGAGGLGVVFKAYDPDLDRQVALKMLRLREGAAAPTTTALLDEARLMAQVAHDNVVTIHDVGAYTRRDLGLAAEREDNLGIPTPGVFLVMELLERGSLRDLLKRNPDTLEVLPLLLEAARGVAAAHAKGIVHRDFKPSNVLIGADGRVRVGDFGLALPVARTVDGSAGTAGTPAYMAPEQLRGGVADMRSDQYALALTCYVALYGVHPFRTPGASVSAPPTSARGKRVPRPIHAVLRRALLEDPAARFPDVPSFIRALSAAWVRRRRRLSWVAGGMLGAAGLSAALLADENPSACESAGAVIDSTWNDEVRAQLNAAFAATGVPFAASSGDSVRRTLDTYAHRWRQASHQACADTHERRVQSTERLDVRTACLERRRNEFAEAVRLMLDADPELLVNAVPLVHGLGWIDACADPRRHLLARQVPDDPDLRQATTQVWGRLGRARLLELGGRYAEATALARGAVEEAELLGDGPLHAAASLRLGSIAGRRGTYVQAKALLLDSIQRAQAAGDDELCADGWIRLLWVAGVELQDPEAQTWADFARAALERLGGDPMRAAELSHNLGGVAYRNLRFDEALAHYQSALDAQRALLASDDPRIARTLNHIANVLLEMSEPQRALSFARQSLTSREQTLGGQHPLVAASLNNVGSACLAVRDLPCAEAAVQRSLAITDGRDLPEAAVAAVLADLLARAATDAEAVPDGR